MMDLGMNFKVAPEIYNITADINSTTASMLLSTNGTGLNNPESMYTIFSKGDLNGQLTTV